VFQFAQNLGLTRSQFWDALVPAMEHATGPVRDYMDGFVRETVGELFVTPEACSEFYSKEENFRRLLEGDIGDNLMHKYRAVASFHLWPDICQTGMDTMKHLLVRSRLDASIPDFDRFWSDFHRYIEFKHAHGHTVDEILTSRRVLLGYDVDRWISDGMPRDPSPYRLAAPAPFQFFLTEESREGLENALKVWTPTLKGLSKMVTRIKVAWQVHQCMRVGREDGVAALA